MRRTETSFVGAMVGLLLAPRETTAILMEGRRPRYGLPILLLFYLVIIVPVIIQSATTGMLLYQDKALAAILMVPTLTIVYFVFLEAFFLRVMGVRLPIGSVASLICYSLVPFIAVFLAMYIINYLASGSIAYLTIVLNGYAEQEVAYKNVVPWVVYGGVLLSFIVFFRAITVAGDLYSSNAFAITILSIFPLLCAFIGGIHSANFLLQGLSGVFLEILNSPASMLGV